MLEEFLDTNAELFVDDYVVLKIDVEQMEQGEANDYDQRTLHDFPREYAAKHEDSPTACPGKVFPPLGPSRHGCAEAWRRVR